MNRRVSTRLHGATCQKTDIFIVVPLKGEQCGFLMLCFWVNYVGLKINQFILLKLCDRCVGYSVSIMIDYRHSNRGAISSGAKRLSLNLYIQTGYGSHPAPYSTLSPRPVEPMCEDYHSSPSCTKVKKEWSYTSIISYVCMAWCLISIKEGIWYLQSKHVRVLNRNL
jgi:hypothetical protein